MVIKSAKRDLKRRLPVVNIVKRAVKLIMVAIMLICAGFSILNWLSINSPAFGLDPNFNGEDYTGTRVWTGYGYDCPDGSPPRNC